MIHSLVILINPLFLNLVSAESCIFLSCTVWCLAVVMLHPVWCWLMGYCIWLLPVCHCVELSFGSMLLIGALPCWSSSAPALLATCTCHPVYSRCPSHKMIWGAVLGPTSSGTTLSVYSSLHWELIWSQIQWLFTSDVTNTFSLRIFFLCYVQDITPKAIMP